MRLFAVPGALAFALPNAVGRLPMGMFPVAAVLMITARGGSYALAGAVVATSLAASAVAGPLVARLTDRRGQGRVAPGAAALCAAGHFGLVLCAWAGAPTWAFLCCALPSAATPNTGGMARARWAHLLAGDEAARHAATSFEQALDELCYLCGPALAALLCTAVAPEAGTVAGCLLLVGGVSLFAARRDTEPPPCPPAPARGGPSPARALGPLLAAFACTGVVFGSLQVATLAFADAHGQQALAGTVLAVQAAGSAVAGLVFGVYGTAGARLTSCAAAMAPAVAATALAAQAGSLAVLTPALLLAGLATAPTMISGMSLVLARTPRGRDNEGMTWAVTAILTGSSLGSAAAGWAADRLPGAPASAYALPAAAACLAALPAARARAGEPR
ncbi:MFS transporter [Streptomyces hoynatensis]|uniref:MFS transporter n=1 Tax=Streptomyces hoynatensis TaxID=1141874 RepID=A0A3A9YV69_9ACTN|nr:MFS transporter [Streptomyces hoynatensis]